MFVFGAFAASDAFDLFSLSVCIELPSDSTPNRDRYFLAMVSQSTTFSMRVLGCWPKLSCDPSGDKCTTDSPTESIWEINAEQQRKGREKCVLLVETKFGELFRIKNYKNKISKIWSEKKSSKKTFILSQTKLV